MGTGDREEMEIRQVQAFPRTLPMGPKDVRGLNWGRRDDHRQVCVRRVTAPGPGMGGSRKPRGGGQSLWKS